MLVAAIKALSSQSPALKNPDKGLLPSVTHVREISVQIAKAVVKQAVEEGLNDVKDIPTDEGQLEEWVREQMWEARYRPLKRVSKENGSRHAKGELGVEGGQRGGVGVWDSRL